MNNVSLLLFRVLVAGTMMMTHGLDKLMHFGERASQFPSVFGVGPTASLALAVFAEFFCSFAIVVGFATRLAALPVVITMGVAFFIIHFGDPFSRKELALLYLASFGMIFFTGAGSYSIDGIIGSDGFLRRKR
jgi:putative oxidoreductase